VSQCPSRIYWYDGEYEGECELEEGHAPELPFHTDGISAWDDECEDRSYDARNSGYYLMMR
jgi:hypothetical protein